LATEDPFVDDDSFAAVIRHRAGKARWEAAWHLRGDIRVADYLPLVFVNNRLVSGSRRFDESVGLRAFLRLMRQPTIHADCAILLRDFWDSNYWHLLNDVLPRLAMVEALGLDPTIPVVVSEAMMKVHGERLLGTPFLAGGTVIIQPHDQTLCCKELFLLRPGEFASHWAQKVVDRIPSGSTVAVNSRLIYCRREPEHSEGRIAENHFEIEEMFRAAGFMVVSPASMTLIQQKAIFEQAEIIAGINGAAFANALFRCGKPLAIGALVSSNWMSTTIPTMAKVFGFKYGGFVVPSVTKDVSSSVLVPRDTASRLIEWLSKSRGNLALEESSIHRSRPAGVLQL
jgi:capsular polysaccharide biosynthesis protein